MTPDERNRRYLDWLEGGMTKLPDPRWLTSRRYTYQDVEGKTWSAIDLRWERCKAWWYGYTAIYESRNDKLHYGVEPVAKIRGSFHTIDGLPPGIDVYYKLKHFPASTMSPQGRR